MERSQGDDEQATDQALLELNRFYTRFDARDFSENCATLCETIVPEQLDLSEADVVTSFSRLNSHKAFGPDGLKGRT